MVTDCNKWEWASEMMMGRGEEFASSARSAQDPILRKFPPRQLPMIYHRTLETVAVLILGAYQAGSACTKERVSKTNTGIMWATANRLAIGRLFTRRVYHIGSVIDVAIPDKEPREGMDRMECMHRGRV